MRNRIGKEKLEEFRRKHGAVWVLTTKHHEIVFRAASGPEFEKYQGELAKSGLEKNPVDAQEAERDFAERCVVSHTADELSAIFKKGFGAVYGQLCNELVAIAHDKETDRSKEYAPGSEQPTTT